MAMTDEQIERYSRHIILNEVGVKGQKKLLKGQGAYYRCRRTWSSGSHVSCSSRSWHNRYVDADEVDLSNLAETDLSTEQQMWAKPR